MRTKKILAFLISAVMAVQAVPMSAAAVEAEIQETAEILEEPVLLQEEPEEPEVHVIPDVMVSEKATELYAAAVVSGDFEYTVNEDGTATITGFVGEKAGDLVIPGVIDGYTVTSIGDKAFYGCSGFTGSLTIPDSVTSIGNYAFYKCYGFTGSLTIPDSVTSIGNYAFCYCSGFTGSLTIPDSVTSIGNYAFYNCSGFTGSLTIPDSVTSIGDDAFSRCSNLESIVVGENNTNYSSEDGILFNKDKTVLITCPAGMYIEDYTIPDSVTSIGDYAFYDCDGFTGSLTIPDSVTSIGNYAFYSCSGFTGSLTILDSVNSIGNNAFQHCSGFTGNLTIPDSVTSIGNGAFMYCSGFTGSLTIPDSVTPIGHEAFRGCTGFTGSLTIPDSVTSIGNYAFDGCSGFTGSLTIGDSVTSIGNYAFDGCSGFTGSLTIGDSVTSIGKYAFSNCSGFTGSLTIPDSVTSIEYSAFEGCSGFTGSLTIGDSVTSIGERAFDGCSGFTGSLTIPDSVTSIGNYAFCYCSGFTGSLTIPDSVTSIGNYAFYSCSGFTGAYFYGDVPTTWGTGVFRYNADNFTIYYPAGNTSGWTSPTWAAPDGAVYNTATFDPDTETPGVTPEPPVYDSEVILPAETEKNETGIITIKVTDAIHGTAVPAAAVTLGEQTGETDADGKVTLPVPETDSAVLEITMEGYTPFLMEDYSGYVTNGYDVIKIAPEGYAAIVPVSCNGEPLSTSFAMINSKADLTASIKLNGTASSAIQGYQLLQNGKVIAESADGKFSVHNAKFTPDVPVFARMYTADGTETTQELNIEVIAFEFVPKGLSISNKKLSVTIPDDIPLFGGFKIDVNVSDSPIEIELKNDTIKVGFNQKVVNKDLSKLNAGLRKWMDNEKRRVPYAKFNFNVAGYVWMKIGNTGIDKIEGKITLVASYKNGFGKTLVIPVISVPIRVECEVGVSGTIQITDIGYDFENAVFLLPQTDASLKGTLDTNAGVGVKYVSAGLYGDLGLEFKFGILPDFALKQIIGTGEFGLYAKADFKVWKGEVTKKLLGDKNKGTILYQNDVYSVGETAMSLNTASLYDTDSYELNPREYLSTASGWDGTVTNGTIQSSVYDSADPQIVTANGVTVMVFEDDNGGDDPYNFQQLVYSLWTGSGWSTPVPVDGNNFMDADFSLCTDGNEIWLAYTQANRLLTAEDEMEAYAGAMEIVLTSYDFETGTFAEPMIVTANDTYDKSPAVAVTDGIVTLAWVNNADNHPLGMTGSNTVYAMEYLDGWLTDAPVAVAENDNAVISMAVGSYNGLDRIIAVGYDGDNDFSTTDTGSLVQYVTDGDTWWEWRNTPEPNCTGLQFHDGYLYMNLDGDIARQEMDNALMDGFLMGAGVSADYQMMMFDDRLHVFYTSADPDSENGGTNLFVNVQDTVSGEMSAVSLPVTDNDGYVDSFHVIPLDGTLMTVYRRTDVTFTEDSFETTSDLCVLYKEKAPELQITDIRYDVYDLFGDDSITLTVSVTNSGLADAEGFSLQINAADAYVFTDTVRSGETIDVDIVYTILDTDDTDASILLTDENGESSVASEPLLYSDFTVNAEGKNIADTRYANITVRNAGNAAGSGVLNIRRDNKEGDVLYSEEITLAVGAQEYILLEIVDESLEKVYLELTADTNEYFDGDNRTYCTVHRPAAEDDSSDLNADGLTDEADALYLLRHTLLPERYPLPAGDADYDADGTVTAKDAVYLYNKILTPAQYTID